VNQSATCGQVAFEAAVLVYQCLLSASRIETFGSKSGAVVLGFASSVLSQSQRRVRQSSGWSAFLNNPCQVHSLSTYLCITKMGEPLPQSAHWIQISFLFHSICNRKPYPAPQTTFPLLLFRHMFWFYIGHYRLFICGNTYTVHTQMLKIHKNPVITNNGKPWEKRAKVTPNEHREWRRRFVATA
jgi:hypothetical protein